MDFKSYKQHAPAHPEKKVEQPKSEQYSADDKEKLEDTVKQFEGKSESELLSELMQRVNKSKADGTYKPEDFDKFFNQVSPMLNREQSRKLSSIIKMLK